MANAFLDRAVEAFDKPVEGFSDEAIECLQSYAWPGNVRELQNEIRRMLVMAKEPYLGADLLNPRVLRSSVDGEPAPMLAQVADLSGTLKERVEQLEKQILRETLIRHRWNKSRAAQELGLSRVGLRAKIERYELENM
nr:helix-turn-helix domain-containing protein [Marinobacterium ramblicola]